MIRVTELLRWGNYTSEIPNVPAVQEALKRGTAVHESSLEIEPNPEYVNQMPTIFQGYGEAVSKYHEKFQPVWLFREERIDDEELGITGCPDRYGEINGQLAVMDYKTGASQSWHKLQLALYAILLGRQNHQTEIRVCVYLQSDGTFSVQRHTSNVDLVTGWSLINDWSKEKRLC